MRRRNSRIGSVPPREWADVQYTIANASLAARQHADEAEKRLRDVNRSPSHIFLAPNTTRRSKVAVASA